MIDAPCEAYQHQVHGKGQGKQHSAYLQVLDELGGQAFDSAGAGVLWHLHVWLLSALAELSEVIKAMLFIDVAKKSHSTEQEHGVDGHGEARIAPKVLDAGLGALEVDGAAGLVSCVYLAVKYESGYRAVSSV